MATHHLGNYPAIFKEIYQEAARRTGGKVRWSDTPSPQNLRGEYGSLWTDENDSADFWAAVRELQTS